MPVLSKSRSALLRRHDRRGGAAGWLGFSGAFLLVPNLMPRLGLATEPTTPIATPPTHPPPKAAAAATAPANAAATSEGNGAATGANADQALLLDVDVNGQSIGKIGEF